MIRFKVKAKGFDEAVKDLEKLPDNLIQDILFAIQSAVFKTQEGASVAAVVDTGLLRASIRIDPAKVDGAVISGSVAVETAYAMFVEYGTGPLGKATNTQPLPAGYVHGPPYFPPPEALEPWARRHRIEGGGYQVAKNIFKAGGTAAKPFMGPAAAEAALGLRAALRDALRKNLNLVGSKS